MSIHRCFILDKMLKLPDFIPSRTKRYQVNAFMKKSHPNKQPSGSLTSAWSWLQI